MGHCRRYIYESFQMGTRYILSYINILSSEINAYQKQIKVISITSEMI